ncbi:tetratricopeptide repeat protein [Anaerophaga thermohalophila]|uniref:tetratricopeptide repeat protein n=1 Tax=Anaerophaga thermohalophila TaxID=177400 RepID=UPI000237C6CB|nr:tetratricopeptide repeat protein [Anaerophaga thermohalophila]
MKPIILTLTLSVIFGINTFSQDDRFKQGNELYANGNFEEAFEVYESILQSGLESPALYYNLGNAYYKTGELPEAILNYERALLLAPQDADIRYNLELAYEQTADKIDKVEVFFLTKWFRSIRNLNDSDGWAVYSIIAFVLFLLSAGFYLFGRSSATKKVGFSLAVIFLIISGTSFGFSSYQKEKLVDRRHAIIFTPTVNIKSSPDTSGTNLFVLHEGTKVELISKLGEWWNVRLQDGSEGWIHESDVEVI